MAFFTRGPEDNFILSGFEFWGICCGKCGGRNFRQSRSVGSANSWQGVFPIRDTGADGYAALAPVACFDGNSFGLHDMDGKVWEWTSEQRGGSGLTKGWLLSLRDALLRQFSSCRFSGPRTGSRNASYRVQDDRSKEG